MACTCSLTPADAARCTPAPPPLAALACPAPAVYLQDVFEDDGAVHLVMELCEGGSVLDGLKEGDFSERQVKEEELLWGWGLGGPSPL